MAGLDVHKVIHYMGRVYIYMGPFEKGGGIFYFCMKLFSGPSENSGYHVSCDVRYVRM